MTHEEYGRLIQEGKLKQHPLADIGIESEPEETRRPAGYALQDFLPLLIELLSPKRHLTAAPTFTPRNLLEQIQLVDDGVTKELYVYVNGSWVSSTLT